MRLDELYPYWDDFHQELLETVGLLSEAQLDAKPREEARSIRQIVLQFIRDERYWIGTLVAGYHEYRPLPDEFADAAALVEALTVTREVTRRVLAPYAREGLRAVRTVPADPRANRPETNAPVAWLFWRVLELELMAWGQVGQRIDDHGSVRTDRPWMR